MGAEPVVQAVETQWLGPSSPCCMETAPAAMFARILGTRKGLNLQDLVSHHATAATYLVALTSIFILICSIHRT